jgi:hypothetical protein
VLTQAWTQSKNKLEGIVSNDEMMVLQKLKAIPKQIESAMKNGATKSWSKSGKLV